VTGIPVDDTTPALDLDAIEHQHREVPTGAGSWCWFCGVAWPCQVPALIAEVRRLTEENAALTAQRDTARQVIVSAGQAVYDALQAAGVWEVDGHVYGNVGGIRLLAARLAAAEQENEVWRRFSRWSCTRDHRTSPCGDCDGCRGLAGGSLDAIHGAFDRLAAAEARITNATALCDERGLEHEALIEHLRRALTGDGTTEGDTR